MNKSHDITFNNVYGKEIKFELYISNNVPYSPKRFPITNYRLGGKLSDYGLGYHNQRLLLEIADDTEFLEMFNNNLAGDVAVKVTFDGKEVFYGSPEYNLYERVRRGGKDILQIEFQSGLNMSGVNINSLEDDDTASTGWIRLARFYSNLFGASRRDLSNLNVDVEYSVFHRALEYYYNSPLLGDNGYSFTDDEDHEVLWMPLNLIWGRKAYALEDVEKFAMDLARIFNARFGWSWERNCYVFYTLIPPVNLVTSTHHVFAVTAGGDLFKFDTATKSIIASNSLFLNSDEAYQLHDFKRNQTLWVTGGDRILKIDYNLINLDDDFIQKTGLIARSVYVNETENIVYAGYQDSDTTTPDYGRVIAKTISGTTLFDTPVTSVWKPFDITVTNTKIAILTNSATDPNRVMRISKSDGGGSTILVNNNARSIYSDGDNLYVGKTDGTIEVRPDCSSTVSSTIDTGINASANSDAEVRRIQKHKDGYLVAVGKYVVKFDNDWNIIYTSAQGTQNIINVGDALNDKSLMNFALREAGATNSFFAFSDVEDSNVGFPLYVYTPGSSAKWNDFSVRRVPAFDESVKIPVCKASTSNEITSGTVTINDMTLQEIGFQSIDENKWEAWPYDRLNVPVRSANGVVNERVSPSYEDYEYKFDFIGGTNGNEPEQLKHVSRDGTEQPVSKLQNFDWRLADYTEFEGVDLNTSLGRDYIRARNKLSERTRGVYNGLLDPMIPIKYNNGDLLYITDYEINLEYEITNIKQTHTVKNEYFK